MNRLYWAPAAFLLVAAPAHAAILVSNLAEPTRATTLIEEGLWAAQAFETDANAYALIDITTVLGDASGSPVAVAELRRSGPLGIDTSPAGLLTTFTVPSLAGALSVRTLTPDSPVALDPNTVYWIVLGVSGPGSFGWSYAEGNAKTGPGSLPAYGYSTDQGGSWGAFDAENPYKVRIDVNPAAIPEPSTIGLSAVALIAGLSRWRRR
jgi:hypothetical protein